MIALHEWALFGNTFFSIKEINEEIVLRKKVDTLMKSGIKVSNWLGIKVYSSYL